MYGPLDVIASGPAATMATPGSSMVGIGYTPEAIEHNPIVYELLNEMAWHPEVTPSTPLDLNVWVERYAVRRYGANSPSAIAAWQILLEASYKTQWDWMPWSFVEHVPTVGMLAYQAFNATGHVAALRLLYQAGLHREGGLNPDSETFQYDLADLTRQVLANFFVDARQLNTAAFRAFQFQNKNSSASYFPTAATLTNLIEDMDEVLATSPYLLLGSWIGMARTSPNTNSPTEAANREFNARNQVTLWGPNGEIRDYAAKQYVKRKKEVSNSEKGLMRERESGDVHSRREDSKEGERSRKEGNQGAGCVRIKIRSRFSSAQLGRVGGRLLRSPMELAPHAMR